MAGYSGSELLARLKSSVGQEIVHRAPDAMGRPSFRMYALAIGDFNSLYTDGEFARNHGLKDIMAPPTLICDTWQYLDSDMDERGDLVGRGEIQKLGALRAGNDYEFFQPVHPDDVITARWKVMDLYEKTGRSGHLVFLVIEGAFYNQQDELLAKNTETMFFRL
jgi:acyl dehydratase